MRQQTEHTPGDLFRSAAPGGAAAERVAPGIVRLPTVFVNTYFVGEPGQQWAVVDPGPPGNAARVRHAAAEHFGEGARPRAIVLTHGHFDHAGCAGELADTWDAPVFAHPLEMPYLDGRADYPPPDPTLGGAIAFLSRFFPHHGYDLGDRLQELPEDGSVPGAPGWRWLHTPGHTPGHVSFVRDEGGALLAGDALCTMDLDSWTEQVLRRPRLAHPPAPFTTDWRASEHSVQVLASLEPRVIAAGHGIPLRGPQVADDLRALATDFPVPERGRYVGTPARADERGLILVPPPRPDPLPKRLLIGAAAVAGALLLLRRRRG